LQSSKTLYFIQVEVNRRWRRT